MSRRLRDRTDERNLGIVEGSLILSATRVTHLFIKLNSQPA